MRLTLSAALSLALVAVPVAAQGPCDILADAINARFQAGTSARDIGAELAFGAIPGARVPAKTPVTVRIGRSEFIRDTGATEAQVPHVPGVRFVETRAGTASCQDFALYRRVEGRVRALSTARISGGDGELCGDSAIRPLGIGGRAYAAYVDGYGPLIALHPVTSAGMSAAICVVEFETRFDGRIENLEPNDAASVQTRRQAMAALETALPAIADSYRKARRLAPLPGARIVGDGSDGWAVEFAVGDGRYMARFLDEGGRDPQLAVRLARVFPELGNRERPLGSFVYSGERRFVRALSRPAELR
jgi:hypothetical protein